MDNMNTKRMKFLNAKEVCEILRISRPTLDKMRRQGIINARRLGKKLYFIEEEIANAMQIENQ